MTPQELKNSILQLAIQGKLVEQRPEEGTARELFVQIQAEKQRLIEAGKIKKEKPLPEIAEDEKPFEIPESWMWVRLGDITSKLTDGSHNPPPNTGKGVPVISAKNVKNGIITLENVDRFTDDDGFKKENPRTNIIKDDIIMGIIGGSIGNVAVYTHDVKVIAQRSIAIMRFLISTIFSKILLESPLIQNRLITSTSGSAQGGVYLGTLKNLPIPLPPLAEQKRIVAKIEELLPYIDRYEQAWSKLEQLNSRFPEDMKKALLQYAIQGKLVEQRPEEGTGEELFAQIQAEKQRLIQAGKIKKEKPLPEIAEDEKPFDIPEGWTWVRVGNIVELNPKNSLEDSMNVAFVPMACVADGYRNEHTFEIRKWGEIKKGFTHFANGDIGIAKITPCFQNRKSVIFSNLENEHGAGTTELTIVRIIGDLMSRKYMLWFFKSAYFIENGMISFTGTRRKISVANMLRWITSFVSGRPRRKKNRFGTCSANEALIWNCSRRIRR